MTNQQQSFFGHLLNTVITTVATLGVAWFAFKGSVETTKPDQLKLLFDRIASLEERVHSLQDELLTVSAENTMLQIQLESQFANSPRGAIWAYLEALDTPAWCKDWQDPDFKMAYVNRSYETFYKVTRERYVGTSDFDVHPIKVAQAWRENDLKAFKKRGFIRFVESVPTGEGMKDISFWKFYLRMPDNTEMICGIQLN